MKPRANVKPILSFNNVVSMNLLRLRRRIQQISPGYTSHPRRPQADYLRRQVIKARTGGHCRG